MPRIAVDLIFASLRRLSSRVAMGTGLLSLFNTNSSAAAQPLVPVRDHVIRDAEVSKLRGKYILKQTRSGPSVMFAQHRSHSSHTSHASHASHYSSSGVTPPTVYAPPPPPSPPKPRITGFSDLRWNTGIASVLPKTYDSLVRVEGASRLEITPRASKSGSHFNGYLTAMPVSFLDAAARLGVVAVPRGNAEVIFAIASDTGWVGFRIKNREMYLQTQLGGVESHKTIPFDANEHRYLRLVHSSAAQLIAWQTSRDGIQWTTLHSETPFVRLDNVAISVVAGTDEPVQAPGKAIFDTFEYVKQ